MSDLEIFKDRQFIIPYGQKYYFALKESQLQQNTNNNTRKGLRES